VIPTSYPWPNEDFYLRIPWRLLEPTEGQYNFSLIDSALATAKAHGGKLDLVIEAATCANCPYSPQMVPDYVVALMAGDSNAYWTGGSTGVGAYEPDWNSPAFMTRTKALITALSNRYANDPRLGWFEDGFYGQFGEWIVTGLPPNPLTGRYPQPMSKSNKEALINAVVAAFPNTQILQIVEEDGETNPDPTGSDFGYGFKYAMSLHTKIPIGARYDGIGLNPNGGLGSWDSFYGSILTNLWKKAPTNAEYGGLEPGNKIACQGDSLNPNDGSSALTHHVSMLGNGGGGLINWTGFSSGEQACIIDTMKHIGYRFNIDSLTMPSSISPGSSFSVSSTWSNAGITPAYNPWNVMVQLRNSSGTIVWQGKSNLDLQKLLPTNTTGTDNPVSATDAFTLPVGIPAGQYTVSIQVVDPTQYYTPLQLANYNRSANGSYDLGSISVDTGGTPVSNRGSS